MAHAKHVFLCVRYEGPDVLTFTWYYSEIDLLQSARLRTDNSWLRSRASSESVRRETSKRVNINVHVFPLSEVM